MLEPGDRIDIWVIEKRLGAGGMGSVYRCHNHDARRILAAVKILEGHIANHPDARARFVREAEILFTLEHPNIVKVRNVRVDGEHPYIEMEFVQGESLEDRLARVGGLTLQEALPTMGQIASAVAYLHSRGVRHRDIKPANILLDDYGVAKLVDFGLAMEAGATRLTQGHMSFGTVSYAPPEWVDPENLDPIAWDMYALGVVFWEMLTGAVAFPVSGEGNPRQQAFQVVLKKQNHDPLDPGDEAPDALRDIIADLTRKDPTERLTDALELLDRLEEIQGMPRLVRPSEPRPGTPIPRPSGPSSRPIPDPTIVPPRDVGETFAMDARARSTPEPVGTPRPADDTHTRETLLRADIEPPDSMGPGRRAGGAAMAVAVVLVLLLLLGVGGGIAAWLALSGPAGARPVDLEITGLGEDVPFDVVIGDRIPSAVTGRVASFGPTPPGEHEITWVVGQGCEAVACTRGSCPSWCLSGTRAITVPSGDGTATLPISLAAPAPRTVRFGAGDSMGDWPVAIAVEGVDGAMDGATWTSEAVLPGTYRARVVIGTCDADVPPCEDECPAGCRDVVRELVVPLGDGIHRGSFSVQPPEKPASPDPTPRTPTAPDRTPGGADAQGTADPAPAPTGTSSPVSQGAFARWLTGQALWHPDAAKSAGRADEHYLEGWDGLTPPSAGSPVVNVTGSVAKHYCATRGGLAAVDTPPTTWTDDHLEFRMGADGRVVAVEGNGTVIPINAGHSNTYTSFRCMR